MVRGSIAIFSGCHVSGGGGGSQDTTGTYRGCLLTPGIQRAMSLELWAPTPLGRSLGGTTVARGFSLMDYGDASLRSGALADSYASQIKELTSILGPLRKELLWNCSERYRSTCKEFLL